MNIILIGGDKLAYFLCKEFVRRGFSITAVTNDSLEAQAIARETGVNVLLGDGSSPLMLQQAQAYRADVLVALTSRDDVNLAACQIAKQRYSVPRTIALVNDPDYRAVFGQLGVTVAFSATQILANLIEERLDFEAIQNLIPIVGGQVQVSEVVLPPDSPVVGKQLQHIDLPEGSLIGCIVRGEAVIVPRGWSHLQGGDRLVLLTQEVNHQACMAKLTNLEE